MDYGKVNAGDDLTISASQWNDLMTMLAEYKSKRVATPSKRTKQDAYAGDVIKVTNTSSTIIQRYYPIGVTVPAVLPSDNEQEYLRRHVFSGGAVVTGQTFGIALTAIAPGQTASVCMHGIAHARVNVTATTDTFADVVTGTTTLKTGASGLAELIWVAGGVGSATATGEQWATIKLGGGGGDGLGKPTALYQVPTPIDWTLTPVWTTLRAID